MKPGGILTILTLGSVILASAMCVTSLDDVDQMYSQKVAEENVIRGYTSALEGMNQAEGNFVSQRTFELPYTDIDNTLQLLRGVAGISIVDVKELDPKLGFTEIGIYSEGSGEVPSAVRINMVVTDVPTALRVLGRAQLAINELTVTQPNAISVDVIVKKVVQ